MAEKMILKIEQLRLRVADKELLDDFSLELAAGEKVALSGYSGCGKSTLLSCILGFVPPVSGKILVGGLEVVHANLRQVRRTVAWVPQFQPAFTGSLREWLLTPLSYKTNRGIVNTEGLLDELMQTFGMESSLLQKPQDKLSGGEKQRAALISALLLQRPLILLDEPTASLDEESRSAVLDYFCEKCPATVLMVAHDERALAAAGRVVKLSPDGRKENNGHH